jgi:hypothetical protein
MVQHHIGLHPTIFGNERPAKQSLTPAIELHMDLPVNEVDPVLLNVVIMATYRTYDLIHFVFSFLLSFPFSKPFPCLVIAPCSA